MKVPASMRTPYAVLKAFAAVLLLLASLTSPAQAPLPSDDEINRRFLGLLVGYPDAPSLSLAWIDANWQERFVPMALEILRFIPQRQQAQELLVMVAKHTGVPNLGNDWASWMRWQWSRAAPPSAYATFKAVLYAQLDPKFARYFSVDFPALIRLDEIVWGGVAQDGIPPLRGPKMLTAKQASYLADTDVVFGVEINGDARAYPKRILAWHEMFTDRIGGLDVAGVYCTLCGAVVVYETVVDGRAYALGTSGFLYRSNKLMYDAATQSLWSMLEGRPVYGELASRDISLPTREVVTTTWGEWSRLHPSTTVLSLDTGHQRDYGEGEAYRIYFATDALMFPVPGDDRRLRNKQEVLIPRFGTRADRPLAIGSDFLKSRPVWPGRYGAHDFVVLTDRSGAHRIYDLPPGLRIRSFDGDRLATDHDGVAWSVTEAALVHRDRKLPRLPAHNAFWFGWHATHPDSELITDDLARP